MFGRDNEPIAQELYFGAINQFNLKVTEATNELLGQISHRTGQSAEDFQTDIVNAIEPIVTANRGLLKNINAQRKKWGW